VWISEYGHLGGHLDGHLGVIVGLNSIGDTQRHVVDLLLQS
jgi:hypothetical protein